MAALVDQFFQQANPEEPPQLVAIQGRVREPGVYPILATNDWPISSVWPEALKKALTSVL